MAEMAEIKAATRPHEILLVADSLTGQDAVNLARSFDERVGITGIVLTRADGDGRGGAALSMRAVTGKPIKLLGVGEKLDALEDFDPARVAGRILGMGDIVGLVEKAAQAIDAEKAAKAAERMRKGVFDLNDLAEQLGQMKSLGGMSGLMGMMPGVGKAKKQIDALGLDDSVFNRQVAIISSMTKAERRNPDVLKASRKKRVAAGSGTKVEEINRLLKMHRQMADMMKQMGRGKGMFARMGNMLGAPGAAAPNARSGGARKARQGRRSSRRPAAGPAARSQASRSGWWRGFPRPARTDEKEMISSRSTLRKRNRMSLKIRLSRAGAKKRPYYRIVIADSRYPRDGRFIEIVGSWNPILPKGDPKRVELVTERVQHWLKQGAQPTDRVLRFLDAAGLAKRSPRNNPDKAKPGKKAQERLDAAAAAAAAARPKRPPKRPPRRPRPKRPWATAAPSWWRRSAPRTASRARCG